MPKIRDFEAPDNLGLTPSDRGTDATAAAARRVGAFYNQVGGATEGLGSRTAQLGGAKKAMWDSLGQDAASDIRTVGDVYTKYEDHRQVALGAASGAELMSNINKQWEDTAKNADPRDPTVAAKFHAETLEPALDNFKKGFTTERSQQWAEQFVDRYRNHVFEKTAATMSSLAGEAVKVNVAKTANGLASAVSVDPSVHSIDNAFWTIDHSVGAMVDSSPTLSAAQAATVKGEVSFKAKEAVVKAAVSSLITKNPNVDLDAIQKKYGDYIKGDEMKVFQAAAIRQAKTDAAAQRQDAIAQRQLADLQVHAGATKVLTDNVSIDPTTGHPLIKPQFFNDALDIAKRNPNAPSAAATVRTMLDWGESQQNKEKKIVDDPEVLKDLIDRLFDPDKPTTRQDLMRAQIARKLSDHSFQSMERLVTELDQSPLKGPIWQAAAAAAKDALIVSIPGLTGKDSKGTEAYSNFMQTFLPQYLAKSRAGTLEPNALDTKDPASMISKAMAPFKRTPTQRMQDWVANAGGITTSVNAPAVTLPEPDKREVGKAYPTARGKMKWTGTGWVEP